MLFIKQKISLATIITVSFFSISAYSQNSNASLTDSRITPTDRILFDYNSKNILVYGIYSQKINGKKNGIDAEFAARREGKQIATDNFPILCKNSGFDASWNALFAAKSDWSANSMTSQGSEIFSDGVLLIKLTAPFSSVLSKFSNTKIPPITSTDGNNFVFKIPQISLRMLRCGTVTLRLSPTRTLIVAPGYASKSNDSTQKISLIIKNDELVPATAQDAAFLKNAQFENSGDDENEDNTSPIRLPITQSNQD